MVLVKVFFKKVVKSYLRDRANQYNVRNLINRLVLSSSVLGLGTDKLNKFRRLTRYYNYYNSHEHNYAYLSRKRCHWRIVAND